MTLEELRIEIDTIDDELAGLLARRMALAAQAAAIKRESGAPVLQPEREQAVLARLCEQVQPEYRPAIAKLYKAVFQASRELQEGLI